MALIDKLQYFQQLLGQSPLLAKQRQLPNQNDLLALLQSYRNESRILLEKSYNPLNIVLMGEVKAGKSTLLNAFAGDIVSPTNITETTASIIEIKHSSQKKGTILKKNGENVVGTPNETYELLDQNRGNREFFSEVSLVSLEFPLPNLRKLHLVDTPGLATVTSENEQTTTGYIQNSDVVLWVFSAHHLGQYDIEEQLENVKSYGKPVIAVINRLDQVDGSAETLEEYIDNRLGFYLEGVFAVSAFQALEGIQKRDQALLEQSRFPQLLAFLEENIEKENKQVQEQSILSAVKALAEKERIQHQMVNDTVTFLLQSTGRRKEELKYHNNSIKKKINSELQNWVHTNFLDEERRILMREVDNLGMMSGKASYEEISSQVNRYVSSEYILENLNKKFTEINKLFQQEWDYAIQSIGEKINLEEEEFRNKQSQLYKDTAVSLQVYLPEGENAVKDGAMKGAAIGGAYGFAAATYAAVLGPSAAGITMGTALAAVMPPVLIIGAVTGIAAKLVFGNKKKKEYTVEVMRAFNETKQNVSNVFLPVMIERLETESNRIANDLFDKLCSFMSQGWTEKELRDLQQNVTLYNSKLVSFEQSVRDTQLV